MDCIYFQYCSKCCSPWISSFVYSKDRIDFAMLFTLETTRKAGGLQILRCQGIAVAYYGFTLDSVALRLLLRWGYFSKSICPVRMESITSLPVNFSFPRLPCLPATMRS